MWHRTELGEERRKHEGWPENLFLKATSDPPLESGPTNAFTNQNGGLLGLYNTHMTAWQYQRVCIPQIGSMCAILFNKKSFYFIPFDFSIQIDVTCNHCIAARIITSIYNLFLHFFIFSSRCQRKINFFVTKIQSVSSPIGNRRNIFNYSFSELELKLCCCWNR